MGFWIIGEKLEECPKCRGAPPRRCETKECDPGGECMSCGAVSGEACQDYSAVHVGLHKNCAECCRGDAAVYGLCLKCVGMAFRPKLMKSAVGRAVQADIKRRERFA